MCPWEKPEVDKMGKTTSKTEKESWIEERIIGIDHHYKTTIFDDETKVEGRGSTPEKAQERASGKWEQKRQDSSSDSGGGGGSSNSGSSSSGGGCYITTACVQARSLPDDCLELNVLRGFRDMLLQTPSGRGAVREYDRIAPEIVTAVNQQVESGRIWDSLYQDIHTAATLVLAGRFAEAFSHYQRMTSSLKEKYLS